MKTSECSKVNVAAVILIIIGSCLFFINMNTNNVQYMATLVKQETPTDNMSLSKNVEKTHILEKADDEMTEENEFSDVLRGEGHFKDEVTSFDSDNPLVHLLNSTVENVLREDNSLLKFSSGFKNPCIQLDKKTFNKLNVQRKMSKFKDRKYLDASENVTLCLPSFFLVGARKSATSDLAKKLMAHQNVYTGKDISY